MTILEMKQKRAGLVNEARTLLDENKEGLNTEQRTQYDKIMVDVDKLADQIKMEERQQALESEIRQVPNNPFKPGADIKEENYRASQEYRDAFNNYLATGKMEFRALQADVDASGGFTFATEQFISTLIKALDNSVIMRQIANVIQVTNSDSLGAPTLAADPSDADWTTEIAAVTEDSAMSFGKRQMQPQLSSKLIKVSQKLLRVSALPIDTLIAERFAYKFGITEEKAFMTGTGSGQPLGIFVASANGIPVARDVATDNTATAITADGLTNAKYSVKAQYRGRASWIFHRDGVKMIAKLKDSQGQYIWRPGITANDPDTLLGRPIYESEYAPNTFTTGQYVGMFGDFNNYWIADNINFQIQRLVELYATTNQVGFIGRKETDGAPVLAEAFARVKLA